MLELSKGSRVMKLTQLKKLEFFKEVKANLKNWFISIWIPMSPDNLKQPMEGTQPTEEKVEEDKDDEPTKKTGKRRKQIARKGFHTHHDKDETEDSDEANEKDNSTSGTKIPINPVPVATKSPSIANYKIIKQGRKGVYQNVRGMELLLNGDVGEKIVVEVCYAHTTNGYQSTMSDRHKDWLVQEQTALGAKGLTSPEQTATVEMVFSRPWTCTFLVAKGLATPELMANWFPVPAVLILGCPALPCKVSSLVAVETLHLRLVKPNSFFVGHVQLPSSCIISAAGGQKGLTLYEYVIELDVPLTSDYKNFRLLMGHSTQCKAINKVLLAFNSALLCAFSSTLVGGITVSLPSTIFVTMGALPFSYRSSIECNLCTCRYVPSSSSEYTYSLVGIG
ncbi:hypothetical protein Tco_1515978 [Tanacetum coccineum]